MTPPTPPPPDRFDELFLRYWDDTLSPANADELAGMLRDSAAARTQFRRLCGDVVTLTENRAVRSPQRTRRLPRRAVAAGVGLAVLAASVLVVVWLTPADPAAEEPHPMPVLAQVAGTVVLRNGVRQPAAVGAAVTPGDTIVTQGPEASAVLDYPDGASVCLTGGTTATVGHTPARLQVLAGTVSVTVPSASGGIALTTAEADALVAAGARAAVDRNHLRTDVGVWAGRVRMTDASGASRDVVSGEWATVSAGEVGRKQAFDPPPTAYAWDLTRSLPTTWGVGRLHLGPNRPSVRAEFWDDPHLRRRTAQVRSDTAWTRGHALLYPDSVVRVRFAVDRPGWGQLLVVARPDPPQGGAAVVFELPDLLREVNPGGWVVREVRVADMRPTRRPVSFAPPWVAYLAVFNTFENDIGLRVAEFEVVRPVPD